MNNATNRKTFYGWWVVLASSIIIFLGTGIVFYSFGVFIKPLQAEFGWSRTQISLAVCVWALFFGFSGPLVGAWIQKYGARVVIAGCALLAGSCYLLLSQIQQLPHLFILMLLLGVGSSGITLIPNQTLVSNWFDKYRGRAMGIMMAGIGLGGLSMPPIANEIIQFSDWRTSFFVLGLLILFLIIPIAALVVRTRPSDMGLRPDGAGSENEIETGGNEESQSTVSGLTVKQAIRTRSFWMLFCAFMLLVFGESGLTVHFVALVDDAGVSSRTAAIFWGLAAGISAGGRLLFGFLADRWNPRNLITATHGFHAVAVALLLVVFLGMGIRSWVSLFPFALIYGLSLGGSAVLMPVLVGRCFGLLNFSKLLGLLMSGFAIGVFGGPVLASIIYDTMGNYRIALIVFAIGFVVAACAVSFVRPGKYNDEFVQG